MRVIGAGRLPLMTEWQIGLTYPLTVAGAAVDLALLFADMRRTTFPFTPCYGAPCPQKKFSVILLFVQQTCAGARQQRQKQRHAQKGGDHAQL